MTTTSDAGHEWPPHLVVKSLRFVRSSRNYEASVEFYRDLVGLEVIDEFQDSYGEDGTIFGLPGWPTHLEVVRSRDDTDPTHTFDDIVFYLPDDAAVDEATWRLRANGVKAASVQHPYWDDWGGTTFLDPDGRKVVYVSWVYGPHLGSSDPAAQV